MLSFADEEEEQASTGEKRTAEEDGELVCIALAKLASDTSAKRAKLLKNPNIDTTHLPDREREAQEREEREQLRKQWLAEQERIKNEVIEITYSYWDGSGHRKTVEVGFLRAYRTYPYQCKKGDDIAAFLSKCRAQTPELRYSSVDNMMYIKEDLIIPHVCPPSLFS